MQVSSCFSSMASPMFMPTGSLLESLIQLSNDVASSEKIIFLQVRNISITRRKIMLLCSLFEELQETNSLLPSSSILCLSELFSVIQKVKSLIQACTEGSSLWCLLQTEPISREFYVLAKEMSRALDILPLSLLKITVDIREQVELLLNQARQVVLFIDPQELQRREELLHVMTKNNEKKSRIKESLDIGKVEEIFCRSGLKSSLDYEVEISKLEAEALKQAGTGGLIVVSNINNLISLVLYSKIMIFNDKEDEKSGEDLKQQCESSNKIFVKSSSSKFLIPIPDEFCCPISLDLMKDPVIIASGQTYDRNSIAKWIDSGHRVCPKSGQRIIHVALIPNYALKSLIQQWCQENNVSLSESSVSSIPRLERSSNRRDLSNNADDHISATKAAADAVKMTSEFLVGKLATGSSEIQRQAAYELRLLAKTGMDNRRIIAEAGAIPFLVTLVSSNDSRLQENAVTALLNLSIFSNNKTLIIAAGAIDNIVDVLESGKTMEARENAAATIFSLSMVNEYKISIGQRPRAVSGLVRLLKEGTSAGKRDAATALYNLVLHSANKASVVAAGAVPLLVNLLTDDRAGITDDALQVLTLVLGCSEGLEEMRKIRALIPLLLDLLRFGSAKGQESSMTLLMGLCKDGGEEVARRLLMNPQSIPSLQSIASTGSLKAQRKADALLRQLNRCCSNSHNLTD